MKAGQLVQYSLGRADSQKKMLFDEESRLARRCRGIARVLSTFSKIFRQVDP